VETSTRSFLKAISHRLPRIPSIEKLIKPLSPGRNLRDKNSDNDLQSNRGGGARGLGGMKSQKSTAIGLNDFGKSQSTTAQKQNRSRPTSISFMILIFSNSFLPLIRDRTSNDRKVASSTVLRIPADSSTDLWQVVWAAIPKSIAAAIAHPFIVLSVRMATETDHSASSSSLSQGINRLSSLGTKANIVLAAASKALVSFAGEAWLRSCITILSREGWCALYTGVRSRMFSAALYSAIPLSMMSLFGLYETVFYRSILSAEGCASLGKEFSGSSSLLVLRSIVNVEGYFSLIRYGMLSCLQIAPGFVSFVGSRWSFYNINNVYLQNISCSYFSPLLLIGICSG